MFTRLSPKHGTLIRFLSEDGIKQLMLKVEAKYMQDNNREMPKAVEPLFFVIDEKNHSIELTDKGIEVLTGTTRGSGVLHSSRYCRPVVGG